MNLRILDTQTNETVVNDTFNDGFIFEVICMYADVDTEEALNNRLVSYNDYTHVWHITDKLTHIETPRYILHIKW